MEKADLYWNEIAWESYLTEQECKKCGANSCRNLIEGVISGRGHVSDLLPLPAPKYQAVEFALNGPHLLPEVPKLAFPRPVAPEVVALNDPKEGDPIIVTGNNQFTQEVILTVLATVTNPLFVLFSNTRGDTLDMAVLFGSFHADAIKELLDSSGPHHPTTSSPLILPGKAANLGADIHRRLEMAVEIGPVCAAELPLYLGSRDRS